jgi:shikimate 5-dehydrogenase
LGGHSGISCDQRKNRKIGDSGMSLPLSPADAPTIHFIGVSTSQSSIMKVFPEWAVELGIPDATIHGIDLPLHASPDSYREVVNFIRRDRESRGALVTTHKIDLFQAAREQFDDLDWFATAMHEVSSISKRNGKLVGQAKDPVSAGRTLCAMLPPDFWEHQDGEVFCMGSGGAGVAITWFLLRGGHRLGRPARVIVSDISAGRLSHLQRLVNSGQLETRLIKSAEENDAILRMLGPRSLIINATGLGKDRPGSPITDPTPFPSGSVVWELNYRGALDFLQQARNQSESKKLQIHDGWDYFIHGWTCVISDVFAIEIPADVATFQRLSRLAARASGKL